MGFSVTELFGNSSRISATTAARPPLGEMWGMIKSMARARDSSSKAGLPTPWRLAFCGSRPTLATRGGKGRLTGLKIAPILARLGGADNGDIHKALIIDNYFHFSISLSSGKDNERSTPGSLSGVGLRYRVRWAPVIAQTSTPTNSYFSSRLSRSTARKSRKR